jgi:hypothetical protein
MNEATPEENYRSLYKQLATLCEEQGWGDPFSYARSKEILAAIELGHTVASAFSGADAFDKRGTPCEYKSTITETCKGAYTGVSVQETWEEQEKYLAEKKIRPYQHFYNRFEGGQLVESWTISGKVVHGLLLPKFKKKFSTVFTKEPPLADPRLSATITNTEIKKYGKRII